MTRLLSNIIKSNYIYFDKKEAKVIDSDSRLGAFQPLSFARIETNESENSVIQENTILEENNAKDLGTYFQEEREGALKEVEELLQNAKQKAQQLLQEAQTEAEQLRNQAMQEGKSLGYSFGIQQAQAEIEQMKEAIQQEAGKNEKEYQQKINELEPMFVEYMIKYIEKITGVLVQDKKEVILYLLDHALKQLEKSKHFMIRISSADYKFVVEQRDKLMQAIKETAELELVEDKTMEKNQCVIETEDRILDCSLDVQLGRLQEELRLLTLA